MTNLDVPTKLIEKNEADFTRKFKFDKAHYHQCIPNPVIENEFITVQICKQNLREADPNMTPNEMAKEGKVNEKYQKCNLVLDDSRLISSSRMASKSKSMVGEDL